MVVNLKNWWKILTELLDNIIIDSHYKTIYGLVRSEGCFYRVHLSVTSPCYAAIFLWINEHTRDKAIQFYIRKIYRKPFGNWCSQKMVRNSFLPLAHVVCGESNIFNCVCLSVSLSVYSGDAKSWPRTPAHYSLPPWGLMLPPLHPTTWGAPSCSKLFT